jgi:hypothetical protein
MGRRKSYILIAGLLIIPAALLITPAFAAGRGTKTKLPKPSITSLTVSPAQVTTAGGGVEISAAVQNATTCTISSTTSMPGLPLTFDCSGGSANETVYPPLNNKTKTVKERIILAASGNGRTKVKKIRFGVAAHGGGGTTPAGNSGTGPSGNTGPGSGGTGTTTTTTTTSSCNANDLTAGGFPALFEFLHQVTSPTTGAKNTWLALYSPDANAVEALGPPGEGSSICAIINIGGNGSNVQTVGPFTLTDTGFSDTGVYGSGSDWWGLNFGNSGGCGGAITGESTITYVYEGSSGYDGATLTCAY